MPNVPEHLVADSVLTCQPSDRVLYARKGGEDVAATAANLGGDKITVEEAIVSYKTPLTPLIHTLVEIERLLLGRPQHCPQTRMDQVWPCLSLPGTNQRLWAECDQGSSEGIPDCFRQGFWSDRNNKSSFKFIFKNMSPF